MVAVANMAAPKVLLMSKLCLSATRYSKVTSACCGKVEDMGAADFEPWVAQFRWFAPCHGALYLPHQLWTDIPCIQTISLILG